MKKAVGASTPRPAATALNYAPEIRITTKD
jgi:hypothetical protein